MSKKTTSGTIQIKPEHPGVFLTGEDALLLFAPALDALLSTARTAHEWAERARQSYSDQVDLIKAPIPLGMAVEQAADLLVLLRGCNVHTQNLSAVQVFLPMGQTPEPTPPASPEGMRKIISTPSASSGSPLRVHQVGRISMLEGPKDCEEEVQLDGVVLTGGIEAVRAAGGMLYQDVRLIPAINIAPDPAIPRTMREDLTSIYGLQYSAHRALSNIGTKLNPIQTSHPESFAAVANLIGQYEDALSGWGSALNGMRAMLGTSYAESLSPGQQEALRRLQKDAASFNAGSPLTVLASCCPDTERVDADLSALLSPTEEEHTVSMERWRDLDTRLWRNMANADVELAGTSDLDLCHLDLRSLHRALQDAREMLGMLPRPEIQTPEGEEEPAVPAESPDVSIVVGDETLTHADLPIEAIYLGGEQIDLDIGEDVWIIDFSTDGSTLKCSVHPPGRREAEYFWIDPGCLRVQEEEPETAPAEPPTIPYFGRYIGRGLSTLRHGYRVCVLSDKPKAAAHGGALLKCVILEYPDDFPADENGMYIVPAADVEPD